MIINLVSMLVRVRERERDEEIEEDRQGKEIELIEGGKQKW